MRIQSRRCAEEAVVVEFITENEEDRLALEELSCHLYGPIAMVRGPDSLMITLPASMFTRPVSFPGVCALGATSS